MVDEMIEWFFENYEDPSESVPYESAEGGYQYYAGGPYEAREALDEQFGDAIEQDIEKAVLEIDSRGGPDWVKISDYNYVQDYEEGDRENSNFDGGNDDEPLFDESPF